LYFEGLNFYEKSLYLFVAPEFKKCRNKRCEIILIQSTPNVLSKLEQCGNILKYKQGFQKTEK